MLGESTCWPWRVFYDATLAFIAGPLQPLLDFCQPQHYSSIYWRTVHLPSIDVRSCERFRITQFIVGLHRPWPTWPPLSITGLLYPLPNPCNSAFTQMTSVVYHQTPVSITEPLRPWKKKDCKPTRLLPSYARSLWPFLNPCIHCRTSPPFKWTFPSITGLQFPLPNPGIHWRTLPLTYKTPSITWSPISIAKSISPFKDSSSVNGLLYQLSNLCVLWKTSPPPKCPLSSITRLLCSLPERICRVNDLCCLLPDSCIHCWTSPSMDGLYFEPTTPLLSIAGLM